MKYLLRVLFVVVIARSNCEAACKFGEITFKEENDAEDVLKHYLQHKLSFANVWYNIVRGRFADPVTNLLTTDKQSLCECVYEKLFKKDTEAHTLEEQHARYAQRSLQQLCNKDGKGILKFEFVVKCNVENEIFFMSQGYQSYEDTNLHDVYVYQQYDKTKGMQFKGMVEKLDFSKIDKHPAYNKFLYHFQNANSINKHE